MGEVKAGEAIPINTYPVGEIEPGSFFSHAVYLDNRFLLTAPEMPFSRETIQALLEWDFRAVYSRGTPGKEYRSPAPARGEAAVPGLSEVTLRNDQARMTRAVSLYNDLVKRLDAVYLQVTGVKPITFNALAEEVKAACAAVREERRFLLRYIREMEPETGENYLSAHGVKTFILSIIMGLYLKMPVHRLIELGVAALLHEIGMKKLPPGLYAKSDLTLEEHQVIRTHPVLGYNLLRSLDFPLEISLAALQHHERDNGTGYPQQLTGEKISAYGKIVAVACFYAAFLGSARQKGGGEAYAVILDLLKNEGGKFDEAAIKALVFSLSLYPIGLQVMLSTGQKALVVDVQPGLPRFPIVQIFGEFEPDGANRIIATSPGGVFITRPLSEEEAGSL